MFHLLALRRDKDLAKLRVTGSLTGSEEQTNVYFVLV